MKTFMRATELTESQYGGSPVKVGEEEYSLFRDHEYVFRHNFVQTRHLCYITDF